MNEQGHATFGFAVFGFSGKTRRGILVMFFWWNIQISWTRRASKKEK